MRLFDRIAANMGSRCMDDDTRISRPHVPLALMLGLSAWCASAILWSPLRTVSLDSCLLGAVVCCVFALGAIVALMLVKRKASVFVVAAGVCLGGALSCCGAYALHNAQDDVIQRPIERVVLEAAEDASASQFGWRCVFSVRYSDGATARVQAYFDEGIDPPLYGCRSVASVDADLPAPSSAERLWDSGLAATATFQDIEELPRIDAMGAVLSVRERAIESLSGDGDASGVLQALVCGYGAAYDETDAKQDFTVCGLAHIVAVSGAHLVIVSSLIGSMLQALRFPRIVRIVLQIALMLGYLVLAGMPVSALRAFVMAMTLQLADLLGRRSAGLSALGACVLGIIALDPAVSVSASFALSALSTLGIALIGPILSAWLDGITPWAPRVLRDAVAMTLASSVLAQPYSCALFSQLPLVSLLANVLVAPLIAPACALGIAAGLAGALAPMDMAWLAGIATAGAHAVCLVAGWCASLPFASIPVSVDAGIAVVVSAVGTTLLWLAWPLPPRRMRWRRIAGVFGAVAAMAAAILFVAPWLKGPELIMLDVGQGDAFLFRSGKASVLVDTGASESRLRSALGRAGVSRLDAVVVTHSDDDHCGALVSLRGTVGVDRVIVAADALACTCDSCGELRSDAVALSGREGLAGVSLGESFEAGAFTFCIVWPSSYTDEGGNADSLCLRVSCDPDGDGAEDASVLMVGDAEAEQLEEFVRTERLDGIDILKVGHHGSKKALDAEILAKLDPQIALVSVGEGNRYGHPAAETIALLEEQGAAIYRTDLQGDVSCRFTDDSIKVSTLR